MSPHISQFESTNNQLRRSITVRDENQPIVFASGYKFADKLADKSGMYDDDCMSLPGILQSGHFDTYFNDYGDVDNTKDYTKTDYIKDNIDQKGHIADHIKTEDRLKLSSESVDRYVSAIKNHMKMYIAHPNFISLTKKNVTKIKNYIINVLGEHLTEDKLETIMHIISADEMRNLKST
jgi:hypothetical protein